MDYRQAIEYIIERAGYERGFVANPFLGDDENALGLRRTLGLLERMGRPDRRYRIVHIAGTKGKGSTCAMVAAIARASGLSVGMYVTPHLHTFRERILLDGEPVSEEAFAAAVTQAAAANEQLVVEDPEIGPPTAYEIVTAMALLVFAEAGVDLAVVEVGLGGRLDATNVVDPDVTAISTVSLDHVAVLGDTIEQIAAEKGGIIKAGRPLAIGPQQPAALAVLEEIAGERGAPVSVVGRDWVADGDWMAARLAGPWGDWQDVEIALAGRHQVENAGLALMTSWLLDPNIAGNESTVRKALRTVSWPGRFELVGRSPDIYVDGAHNVDSMARLIETLERVVAGRKVVLVLGVARDKNLVGMLRETARLNPAIVTTSSHNPRAADPDAIVELATAQGMSAMAEPDTGRAVAAAQALAGPNGLVCVTGSLYVVAEAREALELAETPAFERTLLYR